MLKGKNVIFIIILLLIILGVAWRIFMLNKSAIPAIEQSQSQDSQETLEILERPEYAKGVVSKVEGREIFMRVGIEEKIVVITVDEETEITRLAKKGEIYENALASFGDIESSLEMVVSYTERTGSRYKADKIKILNF